MQKVYKIRHKQTGLFSLGGMNPSLNKKGKTWTNLQALRSHITLARKTWVLNVKHWQPLWGNPPSFPYANCEVVEYIAQENVVEDIQE